jgi:hypothetical protein
MNAIRGRFASYRSVPSRDCMQVVIEFESDQQEQVFAALGYPRPGEDTWVGMSRLYQNPAAPVRAAVPHGKESLPSPSPPPRVSLPKKDPVKAKLMHDLYASLSPEDRAVQDAGMLAKDRAFWEWLLRVKYLSRTAAFSAAEFIRNWCGVESRSELVRNADAREKFYELKAQFEREVGRLPEARG